MTIRRIHLKPGRGGLLTEPEPAPEPVIGGDNVYAYLRLNFRSYCSVDQPGRENYHNYGLNSYLVEI